MNNIYKLFIIEDDKDMCEALSNLLSKWGFEVTLCKDFEKIVECFLEYKPDVVLMDINRSCCHINIVNSYVYGRSGTKVYRKE